MKGEWGGVGGGEVGKGVAGERLGEGGNGEGWEKRIRGSSRKIGILKGE